MIEENGREAQLSWSRKFQKRRKKEKKKKNVKEKNEGEGMI